MTTTENKVLWSDNEKELGDRTRIWSPQEVAWLWVHACDAYQSGDIDELLWQALVESFVFRDADGNIWTLAAEDPQWFQLSEDGWSPGMPFGDLAALVSLPVGRGSTTPNAKGESQPVLSCENCGRPVHPDHQFCPQCGHAIALPITRSEPTASCLNCGQELCGDELFCPTCGESLS